MLECFPHYVRFSPEVPVRCVTPIGRHFIHRFYDTTPISPSGRYIAVTELPFDDRLPKFGDAARVCVIDLHSGREVFSEQTTCWDTQVGAHVQWGADDRSLFFNIADTNADARCKLVDIFGGLQRVLDTSVYMVSPGGTKVYSPDLTKIGLLQPGYGMPVPNIASRRNKGASPRDGLFKCDVASGESTLLVSFAEIYERLREGFGDLDLRSGGLHGFHVKVSPDEKHLMFIVRWLPENAIAKGTKNYLISMTADASDMWMPVNDARWKGGHHPNWCPDSKSIVMNLKFPTMPVSLQKIVRLAERCFRKLGIKVPLEVDPLRLATFSLDGSRLEPVGGFSLGSGHPTLTPDMQFVLTDAYVDEPVSFGDGSVPIRLVSKDTGVERCLVRMTCRPPWNGPNREWRVDPHPAWDRSGRFITLNGYHEGSRRVFVADLQSTLA